MYFKTMYAYTVCMKYDNYHLAPHIPDIPVLPANSMCQGGRLLVSGCRTAFISPRDYYEPIREKHPDFVTDYIYHLCVIFHNCQMTSSFSTIQDLKKCNSVSCLFLNYFIPFNHFTLFSTQLSSHKQKQSDSLSWGGFAEICGGYKTKSQYEPSKRCRLWSWWANVITTRCFVGKLIKSN